MAQDSESHEIKAEAPSSQLPGIKPALLNRRIAAGIIDALIIGVVVGAIEIAVPIAQSRVTRHLLNCRQGCHDAWILMLLTLPVFIYYLIFEWKFGATIGKGLLQLKVVNKDNQPCSLGASLIRNLVRIIDFLPAFYILGAIAIRRSPARQRLGDRIARTIVTNAPERVVNLPSAQT